MKILIMGDYLKGGLIDSYVYAFKKLGHKVDLIDIGKEYRELVNNPIKKALVRLGWEAPFTQTGKAVSQKTSDRYDLIIVMKGWHLLPKTVQILKGMCNTIMCLNADNPFNNESFGATNKNIKRSVPLYDCYLIWHKKLIGELKKFGTKDVHYIPFAVDKRFFFKEESKINKKYQVSFIGNWDKEREWWLSFIDPSILNIWGDAYWLERCKNKKLQTCYKGPAYGKKFREVIAQSLINLNILRNQNKGSHNMRTFEIPACGGFMLAEDSSEQRYFFKKEVEADYFRSPGDLNKKINYYLKHPEKVEKLSYNGYRKACSTQYSYTERVREIIALYKELKNGGVKK